jgi:glutamine synthetase
MDKQTKTKYTEEEVKSGIESGEIKYITLCFQFVHNLHFKRFEAKYFLKHIMYESCQIPELAQVFNVSNDLVLTDKLTFESIADISIKPLLDTFRHMSWLAKGNVLVFGELLQYGSSEVSPYSPRNVLKKTLQEIEKKHGVSFKAASELEFYLINEKTDDIINKFPKISLEENKFTKLHSSFCLSNQMDRFEKYTNVMRDNIQNCGIELESLFLENGPGQHEVNIRYGEILKNCDDHVVLKHCLKHTANELGIGCSFMAKTFIHDSGSSCHVHISAYKDGKNFFAPSDNDAYNYTIDSKRKVCKINNNVYHFIGGLIKYMRDCFLIYAPFVNSYKRFQKDSLAPLYLNTWSYDSRTSNVRIIGEGESLHIEVRIAGADVNPYLLLTTIIASGMKGVEDKIVPPPIEVGNAYEKKDNVVESPKIILEAVEDFKNSKFTEEVFGKDFKDLLVAIGNTEWDSFLNHISNYEINRYLDSV